MWADNDNHPPRDYFMPRLSPWRYLWLILIFSIPFAFLSAIVRLVLGNG